MGRCARAAWDHAVEEHRRAAVPWPGVTTAHLLLGVLQHEECAGGLILRKLQLDVKLASATTAFVLLYGRRGQVSPEDEPEDWAGVPHTPSAKRVLDLSLEEANRYSSTY